MVRRFNAFTLSVLIFFTKCLLMYYPIHLLDILPFKFTVNQRKANAVVISTIHSSMQSKAFIIFVGERNVHYWFTCLSKNNLTSVRFNPEITYGLSVILKNCKWTNYIATCDTAQPMISLSIETTADQVVNVLYKHSVQKSVDVVVCISPLFLYERWQMLVAAIEIWQHYGANEVAVYYLTALETVYHLLKAYESAGRIRLEIFPSLPKFEDNINLFEKLDWRNQVSAYTDCLYLYRESAQFIIFADTDDILVPRLGPTYLSEFKILYERWPKASGFLYNRQILSIHDDSIGEPIEKFRLNEVLLNLKPGECYISPGTKYAVIPARVIGTWIHHSGKTIGSFTDHVVSCKENAFMHFRHWIQKTRQEQTKNILPKNSTNSNKLKPFFEKTMADMMQERYEQVIYSTNVSHLIPHDGEIFMPAMKFCYAHRENHTKCPGPHMCNIPAVNRTCVFAKGKYNIIMAKEAIKFAIIQSAYYEVVDNCKD